MRFHLRPLSLLGFIALVNAGCATTIAGRFPHLDRRAVCVLPREIEPDATEYIFTENNVPVSNLHPEIVERVAPNARTVFEYEPDAEPDSVRYLPAPYNTLTCPARFSILPSQNPVTAPLPEASLGLSVYKVPAETVPVPEPVAKQLAGCPSAGTGRFGAVSYRMNFNVYVDEKGEAVGAYVKRSTLDDDDTAQCMLEALRKTKWSAPETAPVVAITPAAKLFMADGPSPVKMPKITDLMTEIQRNSPPAVRPPSGTPAPVPFFVTISLGPLMVGIGVGVTISVLPRETAPRWLDELNPITRRPYTGPEEFERIKRLSPEEIARLQQEVMKATQPQAPPVPEPQKPPPEQPEQPECPRNEIFVPIRTDNATGCTDKKGNVRCYSSKHRPCAGVHTHGKLRYQEIRNGICKSIEKKAVRCDGPFEVTGQCGSVSTVECNSGGSQVSGIYEE